MMDSLHQIELALILNGSDIITGLLAAVKNRTVSSIKIRNGVFKKLGYLCAYFLAWFMDVYGADLGFMQGIDILPALILYVCLAELISIIENIHQINPDILPDKLMHIFHISEDTPSEPDHSAK